MNKLKYLIVFTFLLSKLIFSYGFGVHAAHYSNILALNDQYKTLIEDPRYKPYFIYGSIFPDLQYAGSYKSTLKNLYQQIRHITIRSVTKGVIGSDDAAFDGLTYEINTDQIPDVKFPLAIDTHNDKYGMSFAEYLLDQCAAINPPGPNPGSNGITLSYDARNMKLAFALGYYAHLCEDVACHDFLIPKLTAELNLGDIELVRQPSSFSNDPNSQTEGIVEGIMDHYYGDNSTVSDVVYNQVWVSRSQYEQTITQMDMITGYAHLFYNGPNPTYYDAQGSWPEMNPVLLFFQSVLNDWCNNNPKGLPSDYKVQNQPLLSASGLDELATTFRFVNRFYPAIAGLPVNGNPTLSGVLADYISTHLNFSDTFNAWAIANPVSLIANVLTLFTFTTELNVDCFAGWAYPGILSQLSSQIGQDARSLVSLMLSDINQADYYVSTHLDIVNVSEYNKLKSSILFTNPTSILNSYITEYKNLGTQIYHQIGINGKWYSSWSPWHAHSMAWGALSSLNMQLPDIYFTDKNVAVYDAYFKVNDSKIIGPVDQSIFANNPTVKVVLELYNTSNVSSESLTLRVKKDFNSTDYNQDPVVLYRPTRSFALQC